MLAKRLFDLFLVAVSAPAWLPVMAIVAVLVRLNLGSPVLFRQQRAGKDGRIFKVIKFRTMRDAADASGRPLPDSVRLTRFGRWLRGTSLDELPEIFNVLRGEMSLVGPRPLLAAYLPRYSPFQRRRHEVLPGITGWAQVKGRNALTWEERFAWDIRYVDERSVWLDLAILLATVGQVLRRRGISAPGEATMAEFRGSTDVEGAEPR